MAAEVYVVGEDNGTASPAIVIVEDDASLAGLMAKELAAHGYHVEVALGRAELQQLMGRTRFDLLTLDLNLDGDPHEGLEIARELRQKANVPIIAVTASAQPLDRLAALELGIDDYVLKPFLMAEVVLRVKRVLARYASNGSAEPQATKASFADFVLDLSKRRLMTRDGSPIDLTEYEFNLLLVFVRAPARILSRDDLSRAVRGRDWSPLDRTIDVHVARLRRKLEPDAEQPGLIRTVRSVGYVFTSPVQYHA